ncbi:MAG: Uma2 family endonuclease [Planctomycetes bacterium]|nr:Uma2 family endonuclease [Planctomycetota bacterium]
MSIVVAKPKKLELHNGDHLSREEFHRIYEQMPENFRAELIGGIVYVASPMRSPHGRYHTSLAGVSFLYLLKTPGVDIADNATVLLSDENEPQPDLSMFILPEFGGHTRLTDDDYLAGPPELIAEIAHSSWAIDLHAKRAEYARHGVLEYLVLNLKDERVHWFDLTADRELQPDADGIIRVKTFPGLWIDTAALMKRDHNRLAQTLAAGTSSPQHAEFVQHLQPQTGSDE